MTFVLPDSRHSSLAATWCMALTVMAILFTAGQPAAAQEIANGSFEQVNAEGKPASWISQSRELVVEVDETSATEGRQALMISDSGSGGSAFIKQQFDLGDSGFAGATLSGYIRTQNVAPSATLVAILEGPDGRIFVDDMRDRVVAGSTDWQRYSVYIPSSDEARKLTVGALVIGSGTAWFDDIQLGRHRKEATTDLDPRAYVLEALSIMRDNYLHTDEVDWDHIRDRGLDTLSDNAHMAQARAAVRMMLEALDDPHVTTSGPRNAHSGGSEASEPIENVKVELVSEEVALVRVPYVPGTTPEKARVKFANDAHRALKSIDSPDLCGWVVDLRDNSGGNMWPMLAAVGPIAGPGVLGHFQGPNGDEVTEWVYRDGAALVITESESVERAAVSVDPFQPINPDLPVAVLISGNTSSSGEATTIAFIGRDDTRLFGSETGGLATANNGYPLSDGTRIVFPIGYMADRHGNIHYPGVHPDENVSPDEATDHALEWLWDQPGCTD